ncbi:TetR/AcrR family transcriptional regulator [Rubellimicrobium aerolatum]|uniref:TetR/AcrR family transcriptional regulator n=1 Tax=Rubellimicrobium aerolatum TaxID=490979 RepID=A0ABW0SGF8_9RHOB|nr:AcrR family transcriptional regulator [Rubellimicrobium aerolatum]
MNERSFTYLGAAAAVRHESLTQPPAQPADAAEGASRGDALLALARQAFVEKGFDGASMQDLARAAGMSAGNFYRYFPSKAALVEALIARDFAGVEEAFRAISASDDPLAALRATLRGRVTEDCGKDHTLWAEIMAVAGRKPEVAVLLDRFEHGIVARIVDVLALVGQTPPEEAQRRFGAHARLIVLIVRGAICGHGTPEDGGPSPADGDLNALIFHTIDRLIDDVLAEKDQ